MSSIDNAQNASGLFAGRVIPSAWAPTRRQLAAQSHAVLAASVAAGAEEIARLNGEIAQLRQREIGLADRLGTQNLRRILIEANIRAERAAQDQQWGGPEHDDSHDWVDWSDYIRYQLLRVSHELRPNHRDRFVKVAALAIAALESIDRRREAIDTALKATK